jgi:hypothetical protein
MEPTRAYPAIVLLSLVTVEFGGWSLLRLLTGSGLSDFEEQFFRAGHGHAGVLLVLSLVYFVYLGRTRLAAKTQWALGGVLLVGVLAQSGGFFLHFVAGEEGQSSIGTIVTGLGGVLIAVALVVLAVSLFRTRGAVAP